MSGSRVDSVQCKGSLEFSLLCKENSGREITALKRVSLPLASLGFRETGQRTLPRRVRVLILEPNLVTLPFPLFFTPSFLSLVAMYREPSLHDVGETVPKAGVTPSKSTSASAIMNGGKPVNKSKTT